MRRLLPYLSLLLSLPAFAGGPGDHVVATVAGEPITIDEIDATGEAQLTLLKDSLYWARLEAAESLIARRVMEAEAKEQGLSLSSYIEREVTSKVDKPTEEEIAAFWAQNPNAAPPEEREHLHDSVVNYMIRERSQPIREALVSRLMAKHAPGLKIDLPTARIDLPVDGAPSKGRASAPVTLVAFTDYGCPGCASLVTVLDYIENNFGENVRIVHRDFPNDSHEGAFQAAVAARCAGRFGQYWAYHDRLFTDVKDLSPQRLNAIAEELDLDREGFSDCLASEDVAAEVTADRKLGEDIGITGTPHLVLNGLSLKGGLDGKTIAQLVAMELDRLKVPAPTGSTGHEGHGH